MKNLLSSDPAKKVLGWIIKIVCVGGKSDKIFCFTVSIYHEMTCLPLETVFHRNSKTPVKRKRELGCFNSLASIRVTILTIFLFSFDWVNSKNKLGSLFHLHNFNKLIT